MAVRRVLILTASFGEGHNAAACNLCEALTSVDPNVRVEVRDIFAEAYGWINTLLVPIYLWIINWFPKLWQWIFQWLNRLSMPVDCIGSFDKAVSQLRRVLHEFQPDVVVSTYPGCSCLLDYLHKKTKRRFQQIVIVTDSLTINRIWHMGYTDWYLVANEKTAMIMRGQGVLAEKIRVTGFPVPLFFAKTNAIKSPPNEGQLWQLLFMVNSGNHIAIKIVRELLKIDGVNITITVGRNQKLEERIRRIVEETGVAAQVYGWTKELPRLIAEAHVVVSKAGGATVQECLAGMTPMIVSQIVPGQEEGNARLIFESGAGAIAITPESIAHTVREIFADKGAKWQRWQLAVTSLSRPNASREISEWILNDLIREDAAN